MTFIENEQHPRIKKSYPRLENFTNLFKLLLKNKTGLSGLIISSIYFILAFLDTVDPRYIGVNDLNSMLIFLKGTPVNSFLPTAPTLSSGWWYYFGTTEYGIPIFPAMLAALKFDIGFSLVIVIIGTSIGTIIGAIAGYMGGYIDGTIMRITDIFLSVPLIVLAIAVTFFLGSSFTDLVIALIIVSWPMYARLSRGVALTVRSSEFNMAAIASGSSRIRNVFVHVIPHILSPILVQMSLSVGRVIIIFAALYFLSIVRGNPYLPELGNMMVMGQNYLPYGIWWPVVIPGIFLVIFVTALNLMGDGLRDVLDPRMRS